MSHAGAGFGVNHGVRGHLGIEDGTDEHAQAGLLVVQVCRLGTIPREIPDAAALVTVAAISIIAPAFSRSTSNRDRSPAGIASSP
jgi:hypothetical protein